MTLPATGGTWAETLEPNLNPLAVRYWQITDALICDYLNADGSPRNLADPACGLGSQGVFTPFATDGSIRQDLLISSGDSNQGWYYFGELKEDTIAITPDLSVQETQSAQSVRTIRNVLTKLDDELSINPIEATPLIDVLRYELPLSEVQPLGTPGYQLVRPQTDVLRERQVVLLGVDTDGQLRAEVYPRVVTKKKGKTELQRKNPEGLQLDYSVLPDPMTQSVMWVCREGAAWRALLTSPAFLNTPVATAVTGLKATIAFTTPAGGTAPYTYSVTQQSGGTGSFSAASLQSTSGTVASGTTTLTVTGLTASTAYVFKVTVTDANGKTSTATVTASVTSTAS